LPPCRRLFLISPRLFSYCAYADRSVMYYYICI